MNKLLELYTYVFKKGLKNTLIRIKSRYFSVSEFVLFSRSIDNFICVNINNCDFEYSVGDIEQLRQYRKSNSNLPREFYIDETHGGKEFYFGFFKGELAQICWVFRKGEYSRFFEIVNDSTCELNYLVTLKKFKGNGKSSNIINFICLKLKDDKLNRVVGAVSANNILMLRGMKSIGFNEINRVKSYYSFVRKTRV